jgi:hypothetical protein
MGEGKFEVAQIREILREVGRFGGIMRLLFVAEKTSPEGTETIAMTSEFEWQKHQDEESQDEMERARRTLHAQILQALLQEGWEPIGTDANGRVMALRRKLPEAPVADPEAFSWQLTRPWRGD